MKTFNLNAVAFLATALIALGSHNLTGATLYVSLDSPNPSPPAMGADQPITATGHLGVRQLRS